MDNAEKVVTTINEDVEITGSLKASNNVQFDGKLNGDMSCTADVVLGASATVKGNLSVENVTVLGQVNGNIVAKDKVDLKSSARITGDIRSKRMTIEDGVTFVGKSEVNPSGSPARASIVAYEPSPSEVGAEALDDSVVSLKEEIRKNVKEEVKSKASGIFSRK